MLQRNKVNGVKALFNLKSDPYETAKLLPDGIYAVLPVISGQSYISN